MDKTILEVVIDFIEQILDHKNNYEITLDDESNQRTLALNGVPIVTHYDPTGEMVTIVEDIINNYKERCVKTLSILSMKINDPSFKFGVNTFTGEVTVFDNGHQETFKSIYHFNYLFPLAYNI